MDRRAGGRAQRRRRVRACLTPSRKAPLLSGSACTGDPGPIFCRLPVMTRSPSRTPLTTLTSAPSPGPSCNGRNSALSPWPTT